jgi:hypothetical protein
MAAVAARRRETAPSQELPGYVTPACHHSWPRAWPALASFPAAEALLCTQGRPCWMSPACSGGTSGGGHDASRLRGAGQQRRRQPGAGDLGQPEPARERRLAVRQRPAPAGWRWRRPPSSWTTASLRRGYKDSMRWPNGSRPSSARSKARARGLAPLAFSQSSRCSVPITTSVCSSRPSTARHPARPARWLLAAI